MKKTIYTVAATAIFLASCSGTKNEVSEQEKTEIEQISTTINEVEDVVEDVEISKAELEAAIDELELEETE